MSRLVSRKVVVLAMLYCCLIAREAAAVPALQVVEGEISIVVGDDFANQRAVELVLLRDTRTGKTYELSFARHRPARVRSGDRVRMTLRPDGARALVEEWEILPGDRTGEAGAAPSAISGALKSVVLIVNFLDSPVTCTAAHIASSVYTGGLSVDSLFQEMSFDLVSFPSDSNQDGQPDVFGPFTIAATTADACEYWLWADAADAAAQAAGVNLGLYGYKAYVLPSNTACPYGGLGDVGDESQITPTSCDLGRQCRSWNFFCESVFVFGHEFGHNLGMIHASSDLDNDGHIDAEYGDYSDIMGSGGLVHFNGPHKVAAGWLPAGHVTDVTASGVFTLAAVEADPASTALPQALRIFNFYQVSYRKPTGYDSSLGPPFPHATSVHRHSDLLDFTTTPPWDLLGWRYLGNTLWVASLADGQSFSDPANGLTVRQLSHSADTATVQVTITSPGRKLYTVPPCRWLDTRTTWEFPFPLLSGQETIFKLAGRCGIPPTARALSANVTITKPTNAGHITFYPAHLASSGTSTINFAAGQTRANNSILLLSAEGYQSLGVKPFVIGNGFVDLIIDVNGYYE